MTSNPITAFWSAGMQSQTNRDKEMRARVAVGAIYAQKVVESHPSNKEIAKVNRMDEQRIVDRPMYGAAHADLKHLDGGMRSTFMAAKHYEQENQQRRDELLAKYAALKEEEQEQQE